MAWEILQLKKKKCNNWKNSMDEFNSKLDITERELWTAIYIGMKYRKVKAGIEESMESIEDMDRKI